MRINPIKRWIVICSLAYAFIVTDANAEFFPEKGDICYTASVDQAWTLFQFASPGPFQVTSSMFNPFNMLNDPGFEMDFAIQEGFYNSCITGTDLPDAYDDCFTAGIGEPRDPVTGVALNGYSFGTFTARAITPGRVYVGLWLFMGPKTLSRARYEIRGQEVSHTICPLDSPACLTVNTGRNEPLYRPTDPNDGLLDNPFGRQSCRKYNYPRRPDLR